MYDPINDTQSPNAGDPGLETSAKPVGLPDKFWDAANGRIRVEALIKAYRDLESRFGAQPRVPGPDDDAQAWTSYRRAVGVPESPDAYEIEIEDTLLDVDPEVNRRLHEAGFTRDQAQLVYDLAADKVIPLLADMADHYESERETAKLEEHFGGEDRYAEIAPQIAAWAKNNLPEDIFKPLAGKAEGVIALHRMMKSGEPGLRVGAAAGADPLNEERLREMMNDPRYWRDKDKAFADKVADGFRRLYGEG